jgi:hypothetical protein
VGRAVTKGGSFKRAARARAKQTGEKFSKVRAEMEQRAEREAAVPEVAKPVPSEERVRPIELVMSPTLERIVREELRLEPRRVEQIREYLHRVVTDDGVVFIKYGRAAETGGKYRLEAWAHEQCRAQGVLVPEPVGAAAPHDEVDYVAMLPLAGQALEQLKTGGPATIAGDALTPILREAGQQLRAMHEIRVDGYGPITGAPPRGGYTRWCPFIGLARDGLPYLVEEAVLTDHEAASLDDQLRDADAAIQLDGEGRLLHGNLEGDHMFWGDGRFTGFLDFDKTQSGEGIYDLARLAWWDPHMLSDVLDGYGRDALSAEDVELRMPAYLVAVAVASVAFGPSAWLAPEHVRRVRIRNAQGSASFIRTARARSDFTGLVGKGGSQ